MLRTDLVAAAERLGMRASSYSLDGGPVARLAEGPQLLEGGTVLRPISPLLAGDHVVERSDPHGDPVEIELCRSCRQLLVGELPAQAVGDLGQDVEVAGIGAPRGDAHAGKVAPLRCTDRAAASASLSPSTRRRACSSRMATASRSRLARLVAGRQSTS